MANSKQRKMRGPRDSVRQKTDRRKRSLMNKAYQYGRICDADVFVGIRLRKSGRMFTFADTQGFWSSFVSQLASYYPTPVHQTEKNFEIILEKGEDTNPASPKEAILGRKIEN